MFNAHIQRLNNKELGVLARLLEDLEESEYKFGGWKRMSGGFVKTELVDYDDEQICADLVYGVQSDCEDRVYTDHITIDRKTMTIVR